MLTQVFLRAYALAESTGVLRSAWGKRQFTRAYFLYKRYLEDYYADLVRARPALFRGGHIIDVGANIGYTAMLFAAAADAAAQVYAFEPDPKNFATLVGLIEQRGWHDKIVPIQAAVGDRDGVVALWRNPMSHADHRIWTPALQATLAHTAPEVIPVPLIRLDSFCTSLGAVPCFVKIDVQGYELQVCRGMVHVLECHPDLTVALEYTPDMMVSQGCEPQALLKLFWDRGFFIHIIKPRGELQPWPRGDFSLPASDRREYLELLISRKALTPAV